MKNIRIIITAFVILCTGCTVTAPKKYSVAPGVATRSLELENVEWRREWSEQILAGLLEKARANVSVLQAPADSAAALKAIDRTIRRANFSFGLHSAKPSFGDALMNGTLDCSDLTLIYLDVLRSFDVDAHPVFARNHVFVSVPQRGGLLYWEVTTGKQTSLAAMLGEDRLDIESIVGNVYLEPRPVESMYGVIYFEMGLQMTREEETKSRAEALYKKAIAQDDKLVLAFQDLASYLCTQDRFKEAEPYLMKAISLDPAQPDLYDFASAMYYEMDDKENSLRMCKKAEEAGSTNRETRRRRLKLSLPARLASTP